MWFNSLECVFPRRQSKQTAAWKKQGRESAGKDQNDAEFLLIWYFCIVLYYFLLLMHIYNDMPILKIKVILIPVLKKKLKHFWSVHLAQFCIRQNKTAGVGALPGPNTVSACSF